MPQIKNYVWAELTPTSKKLLESILPYKYEQTFGTHITLDWDCDTTSYTSLIGKSFKLRVDTLVYDDKCEALPVDLTDLEFKSINKYPHITWSCIKEINPFYSNYLLFTSENKVKIDPVEIEVIIVAD